MFENFTRWDIFFSLLSWLIVVILATASFVSFTTPITSTAGPVVGLIGAHRAQIFYGSLFGLESLSLAIAKLFKQKVFRKNVLLVIYLTNLATAILSIMLTGVSWRMISRIFVACLAAACWLYWKFKIEYINPKLFEKDIEHLS